MQRLTRNLTLSLIMMATATFLAGPCPSFGAAQTWSGAGTNNYWSAGANWGGTAPANWDTLVFSGTTRQNNTNDIPSLSIGAVTFNTGGWTVSSTSPITKTNNFTITVTGTNIWAADTILVNNTSASGTTLVTSDFNRQLTIAGVLSGSGGLWKTAGANGKGNLFLLCPSNIFTGTIALGTGVSIATQFAPKSSPSSFGAGTGTITIGSTASGYGTFFSFVGTSSNFTDRAVSLQERDGSTLFFYNNSPNNSSLWFDSGVTCYSYNKAGGISLGGTSTGTTTINTKLAQNAGTSYNATSLSVNGPGTYVVNGPIGLTGTLTVNPGGLLVLGAGVTSVSNPQITVQSGGVLNVDQIAGGFPLGPSASQNLTAGYATSNTSPSDIVGSLSLGYSGQINVSGPANAGTLNISSNLSLAQSYSGGRILMDLSDQPVLGNGTNDLILVGGDLDLSSQATLSINAYKGTLATGVPYTVIKYSGNLTGDASTLIVPPPARTLNAAASVDAGAKSVQVMFSPSGSAPGNLTWQGTYGADWDSATTQNWLNHGTNDVFMQGDAVTFNDDSNPTFTSVNLAGPLFPSGITVNTTNDFSFSGNGTLGGGSTMTLAKKGTGSLTISTANSQAGNTAISAGTIVAGNNSALGSSTVTLGDSSTGTNDVALLFNNAASLSNPILVSTNGTGRAVLGRQAGGGGAYTGPIQLGRSLVVTNSGVGTASTILCDLNGAISGQGDLTFIGGGYYRLQGVNSFSGNLSLQDSGIVMQVNGGAAIPDTANVYVATNSTLVVFGNETINGLNGAGIIRSVLYSYPLSVGGAGGSGIFSGTMTNDNSQGTTVSVLSLRKVGAGTQVLTGDNSGSTGSTTAAGGVLAINNATGSGTPLGAISVQAGGILAGNGTISSSSNNITVSGVLSVGNAGDTNGAVLKIDNASFATAPGSLIFDTGTLAVDLFSGAGAGDNTAVAGAADLLNATCAVQLNPTSSLTVSNPKGMTGWKVGDKWKIINWGSAPTGAFGMFSLPNLGPSLTWDVSALYTSGSIAVITRPPIPAIAYTFQNSTLSLSWTGNGVLQSAPQVTGIYTNIPGAVSPLVITNFSEPSLFYRLYFPW